MPRLCNCDSRYYCDIWTDYQVLQYSLKEAEELFDQNWNELQDLHNRVCQLEAFIKANGLEIPAEME